MRENYRASAFQIVRLECPPNGRPDAEQREKLDAHRNGQNTPGRPTPSQALFSCSPGGRGELVETAAVIAQLLEIVVAVEDFRSIILMFHPVPDHYQTIRVPVRK